MDKKQISKYNKKYCQRPEVKVYRQTPEYKARKKEWSKKYNRRYDIKLKLKIKYQKNKDSPEFKEIRRIYLEGSKEKRRGYYQKNKEKFKKQKAEHYQIPEIKVKRNEAQIIKKKTNKNFNIMCRMRNSLGKAFKYYTKTGKIYNSKLYGIDYNAILKHLEPFPEDISKYHIDHIKPLCSFTFIKEDGSTDLEEIKKAFAPSNLQWLTAHENLSKGGRY